MTFYKSYEKSSEVLSYKNNLYKTALIHDWFLKDSMGGAEKVTKLIDNILIDKFSVPELFAITESISKTNQDIFKGRKIKTSFIQKLPFAKNHVQQYLPLIPFAIEQIDLREFDLIISSSHFASKGVLTSPDQLHISYVHTPMRYAWDQMEIYLEQSKISRFGFETIIRYILFKLRQWDFLSGQRADYLIANSHFTSRRIKKYWGLSSKVIHPPVEIKRFNFEQNREDFYLCVNRLVPNKRIDLIIKAFNKLGLPLFIVGTGSEGDKLKKMAKSNIKFFGKKSNNFVEDLMSKCRGFVYAGIEDFGIAPIEAMASGAPVIALAKGGILDSVRCISQCKKENYPTGMLFQNQSVNDIYDSIKWFEDNKSWKKFNPLDLNQHSQKFSEENFKKNFSEYINYAIESAQKKIRNPTKSI
tara:strand:- start:1607 stop:2851 length:1245 start_codon:yes stop_codon:yes gene_type:complete